MQKVDEDADGDGKFSDNTQPKLYIGKVTKVLIQDNVARGVEFIDDRGQKLQLMAKREVILAAGVAYTYQTKKC